jgi:hypothetical protein
MPTQKHPKIKNPTKSIKLIRDELVMLGKGNDLVLSPGMEYSYFPRQTKPSK